MPNALNPVVRVLAAAASVAVAVALLSGCATRAGLGTTGTLTPGPSSEVTPEPDATATATAEPTPTASSDVGVPAEGQGTKVVVITLDVVNGTLEASGMLPDVVEEGGECTLTLTKGTEVRTVRGLTAVGPESTYCSLLTIPASQLSGGQWEARLAYRSAAHEGVSAVAKVTVP